MFHLSFSISVGGGNVHSGCLVQHWTASDVDVHGVGGVKLDAIVDGFIDDVAVRYRFDEKLF